MSDLELDGVKVQIGDTLILKTLDLHIEEGSFVCLLGPSGCGKTTTLNTVAGFLSPTAGDIRIDGKSIVHLPPEKRDLGMVFQSYALFPNMTVYGNVAYGLRVRRKDKGEADRIVKETLAILGLSDLSERYPSQLSGGQQQRVSVARALAIDPRVLLMDEPLSNLDAKLRTEIREELKALHRRVGRTTVFVTHDQEEAFVLADRVIVMNQGVVEQDGPPKEVYSEPSSRFVADFVGVENLVDAAGAWVELCRSQRHTVPAGALGADGVSTVGFRAGEAELRDSALDDGRFFETDVEIASVLFSGEAVQYHARAVRAPSVVFKIKEPNRTGRPARREGEICSMALPYDSIRQYA